MKLCAWATAAAILLGAAGFARAADDIVIGAGLTFSGFAAGYGEDARTGIDLAVQEINRQGGLLGRQVKVKYDDTGADRARAVALYRGYAADPEVAAMLSVTSVEFVALDPVGPEVKLPLISIGSASPYAKFSPWSFRVQLIVDKAMPVVLAQLKALRNAKTIAVIYDAQNNYTVGESEAVKAAAPTAGLTVTGVESFRTGEQDFTLQLTRLAAAKPDILYVAATTNEAALLISQARALRMPAQIVGGAGLTDPRMAALPDNAAMGAITYFPFDATAPQPAVRRFMAAFSAANGTKSPAAYTALGYDATLLLADAIRRAGSTDRDKVRVALGATAGLELANGIFRYAGPGDNQEQSPKLFEYTPSGLVRVKTDKAQAR